MSTITKKRCNERLSQELLLDETAWRKEEDDIARQKLELCKETSVHKLISALYKKNEGIGKIALSKLLQICRENHKGKLIEIVVHHILNAAQHGVSSKSCDFLRASLWTVEEMPMDKSLTSKVIEIISKKAPTFTNSEIVKIASQFVTNLKSKVLQPRGI